MVEGLDESFDAALFIGYHARASSGGNPLAHTMSTPMLHCLFPSGGLWRSPAAPFSLNDQPGRLRSNVTTGDLQRHA
jgi:hypothetical protein